MGFFFQKKTGCDSCPIQKDWRGLSHPCLSAPPASEAQILIVDEYPEKQSDIVGIPFSGPRGRYVRQEVSRTFSHLRDHQIRYTSIVRCHVPDSRKIDSEVVQQCSSFLDKEILETRPLLVIGLGDKVLKRFEPEAGSLFFWRGIPFPVRIKDFGFWFFPIFDPSSFIKNKKEMESKLPVFRGDLQSLRKWHTVGPGRPELLEIPYNKNVETFRKIKPDDLYDKLTRLFDEAKKDQQTVGFDIETDGLDPFRSEKGILTMAWGYENHSIAVPINHPESPNPDLLPVVRDVLKTHPWAHHDSFELQWLGHLFGEDWLFQAFYQDKDSFETGSPSIFDVKALLRFLFHRSGILDLGTATRLILGKNIKTISSLDASKSWWSYTLQEWLDYNALDARFESMLLDRCLSSWLPGNETPQDFSTDDWYRGKDFTVWDQWDHVCKTMEVSFVTSLMYLRGLNIDSEKAKDLLDRYEGRDKKIREDILALEAVRETSRRMGKTFRPSARDDVIFLFKDVLGHSLKKPSKKDRDEEKDSADAAMLEELMESGSKEASLILDFRENFKNLGTYIKPIASHKIVENNRIHPQYSTTSVITGRRCVAKGTLVSVQMFPFYKKIPIEEIKKGDLVYCYDDQMNPSVSVVLWSGQTGHRNVVRIHWEGTGTYEQKGFVDVTPEHPIRTPDGFYRPAQDLSPGSLIACIPQQGYGLHLNLKNTSSHKVTKLEYLKESVDVYDIEVEHFHNFIGNEICLHNSSKAPNIQNVPSRNPEFKKDLRSLVVPPEGHVFLSMDYGQLEARIIGMASRDPNLTKYQREDYDIHSRYRDILLDHCPFLYDRYKERLQTDIREKILKMLRTDVKSLLVFASLYGSTNSSCAKKLGIDDDALEPVTHKFWSEFGGILDWRERIWDFYGRYGYVRNLFGRRRYGPLSENEQINFPIQSTAADICREALIRLGKKSFEEKKPWLLPRIEVHDDIETIVPEERLEETIQIQSSVMLSMDFDWITVPLIVEYSVGKSWGSLEEKGKFRGDYRRE